MVVVPALIPKRSGQRIKTNRRDAVVLARLHRAGELTGVWTPNSAHEAVRDLVRARQAGRTTFGANVSNCFPSCCVIAEFTAEAAIGRWLTGAGWRARRSSNAQQIVFQEGIDAIEDALQRLRRLEKQVALIVPDWSMAPVVEAYQAMRVASFLVAVTFAAEIGDVRRFDTPRQLMSFLGLVPAESSTGDTVRRRGLTLAGHRRARRALVEAAWTYRYPRAGQRDLESQAGGAAQARARHRLEGADPAMRPLSLPQRDGQEAPVVVAAIAREMAAFLWAIGKELPPA